MPPASSVPTSRSAEHALTSADFAIPVPCWFFGKLTLFEAIEKIRNHRFAGNRSIEHERQWDASHPEIAQSVGYLRAYGKVRS